MKEQCHNCKWMDGEYGWRPSEGYHNGICRRHAPIGIADNGMGTKNAALWPRVKGDDTCGDFYPYATRARSE